MPFMNNKSAARPQAQPQSQMAQPQLQTPQMSVEQFLESVAQYNEYGKALKRATTMMEVGQKLSSIAQMAEQAVMTEADDWFDAHTVKRNMKEIQNYSKDFMKLAEEADTLNQRMTALYDDMGRILERYFEIPDANLQEEAGAGPDFSGEITAPKGPDAGASSVPNHPVKKGATDLTHKVGAPPDRSFRTEAAEEPKLNGQAKGEKSGPTGGDSLKGQPKGEKSGPSYDDMTLRAIKAVHGKLLRDGKHEAAAKFCKLHPSKMREVVWKLVK